MTSALTFNPRQAYVHSGAQLRTAHVTESSGHCYTLSGSSAFLAFHLGEILDADPLASVRFQRTR